MRMQKELLLESLGRFSEELGHHAVPIQQYLVYCDGILEGGLECVGIPRECFFDQRNVETLPDRILSDEEHLLKDFDTSSLDRETCWHFRELSVIQAHDSSEGFPELC